MNILSNIQSNLSRKARRFMASQEGFTLIELLVVVIIMGVLAAVIVPNVARFAGRGQAEARNTEVKDVQTAIDALMADQRLAGVTDHSAATVGTTGVIDFSSALGGTPITAAVVGPPAIAANYLFPGWMRQNPAANATPLQAYCWNADGRVVAVPYTAPATACPAIP